MEREKQYSFFEVKQTLGLIKSSSIRLQGPLAQVTPNSQG